MTEREKLYMLLTDATEGWALFCDAVWELAGVVGPSEDADARYALTVPEAQTLLRRLLNVDLVFVTCQPSWNSNESRELSRAEAEAAIADPESWRRQPDEEQASYYAFWATEAGKRLWLRGPDDFRLPDEEIT